TNRGIGSKGGGWPTPCSGLRTRSGREGETIEHGGPLQLHLSTLSERRGCPCPCNTPPEWLPSSPLHQTAPASALAPPATDRQKTRQCRRCRSPYRRSAVAPGPRRCGRSPTLASPMLLHQRPRMQHSLRERDWCRESSPESPGAARSLARAAPAPR